jgi:hypothetical protein
MTDPFARSDGSATVIFEHIIEAVVGADPHWIASGAARWRRIGPNYLPIEKIELHCPLAGSL